MDDEEVMRLRKSPCACCGEKDMVGNYIIGYDHTDVDEVLMECWKKGTVLCVECLFK